MNSRAQWYVQFDRIGRTQSPRPMTVITDDGDEIAQAVFVHAVSFLKSTTFEVNVNVQTGRVSIEQGRAGRGTVTEILTLCRDENCPECDWPETYSAVPLVEGQLELRLLAVGCRKCGYLQAVSS